MEKLLISDAAKKVEVETHVLRYWEEELHLPIQRNKQGHRFYTTEDVNRFQQIKKMKEQGFQLKAIRNALESEVEKQENGTEIMTQPISEAQIEQSEDKVDKAARLQLLLQHMISKAVRENNEELSQNIREIMVKELDFQFRQQEEQTVAREEEHYKKLDELLRSKQAVKEKKKRFWF